MKVLTQKHVLGLRERYCIINNKTCNYVVQSNCKK
jgi:hypothetical protein